MLTSDFNYLLPPELIAQFPASPRDSSRLMVVNRVTQAVAHRHFFDIADYLRPGDLLVWNDSKVFKARLLGEVLLNDPADGIEERAPTTEKLLRQPPVEIFLLRPMQNEGVWKVLAKPGRRLRLGMKIKFADDFECEVLLKEKDGTLLVQFPDQEEAVRAKANKYGTVPVPPYIKSFKTPGSRSATVSSQPGYDNDEQAELEKLYQTIYAEQEGSVAAPTAGFHFTPERLVELKEKGVEFATVTLHVGLGTFQPVKTERIEDHQLHSEWVELTAKNADLINSAKQKGRRIVVVGTTTARTLEGVERQSSDGILRPYTGDINIFITPGFQFKIVDVLLTNFHLPESTLLMLVSAFLGDQAVENNATQRDLEEARRFLFDCYATAIKEKYRFYSFGDAMLIQ